MARREGWVPDVLRETSSATGSRPTGGGISVIVVLQFVGTMASLFLPSPQRRHHRQRRRHRATPPTSSRTGRSCSASRCVQIRAASSPSTSARAPRWRSAATCARDLFHRVGSFSAREMNHFGAPSLITRTTNDVQQVQMLVLMTRDHDGRRADHDGRRHPHGDARGPRAVVAAGRSPSPCCSCDRARDHRMVPRLPARCRSASTRSTGSCASRSPASGSCAPSSASRTRRARFGDGQRRADRRRAAHRPLDGGDVPARHADREPVRRRRDLVRRPPRRQRRDAGRGADGVPVLPDADPDGRDDVDLHAHMVPRAAVCADRIAEVLDTDTSVVPARAAGVPSPTCAACSTSRASSFTLPGRRRPGAARRLASRRRPGTTTAIVGSTGAGKSTLVDLVPRLYDATGGAVRVDGVDVRDLDPEVLWSAIGLVPQKGVPVLRHRRLEPAARQRRRHRRGAVGGAGDRPGPRLRRGDARRPRGADRPGRHQRLRRPAAAAGDRPGAGEAAARSTSSTTRSPPSTSPPTPGCAGRSSPVVADATVRRGRPAGLDDPAAPTRSWCSRTARSSATAPTTSCSSDCVDLPGDRPLPARRRGGGA